MQSYTWFECDKGYFGVSQQNHNLVKLVMQLYDSEYNHVNIATAPRLIALMSWADEHEIGYKIRSLDDKPWSGLTVSQPEPIGINNPSAIPFQSNVITEDEKVVWERVNKKANILESAIFELAKIHRELEKALTEAQKNAASTVTTKDLKVPQGPTASTSWLSPEYAVERSSAPPRLEKVTLSSHAPRDTMEEMLDAPFKPEVSE